MKHFYLFFIIHTFFDNGVSCASERTTVSNDAIFFMPDDSAQARPITDEEFYNYHLQMQAANKYPLQNNGNKVINLQYQPQSSTTVQSSEAGNDFNIQYYTTNKYPGQSTSNEGVNLEGYGQTTPRQIVQYEPQYSATIQPSKPVNNLNTQYYMPNNDKRVTEEYPINSDRPVQLSIDQYSSTNQPVTTSEGKVDFNTQASMVPSQGVNVSAAVGQFGLTMLQLANQPNNLVISPYSINTLLALLQQGANGETLQQITAALQMPANIAAQGYQQLTNALNKRDVNHNILKVANGVFVSKSFNLNSDFKNKAVDNFGCEINPINFYQSYVATQKINKWVSNATNNKINELLAPGSVGMDTQLVLVNALLFKGVWEMKFREASTLPRDFNVVGQGSKLVDFLRARRYYRYGEDKANRLQVIVLPFEKQEYSLIVLLPSERSSVAEVLRSVTYAKLVEYLNNAPQDVDLELPKFSVRSDIDLQPLLREMGVSKMFDSTAELFGIVDGGRNSPQVSSAVHSAMLSIDEEGGTAAAATAFTVVALSYTSPDAVFKANRPFVAILWDTKQALPLIMAKITDPTL